MRAVIVVDVMEDGTVIVSFVKVEEVMPFTISITV